MRNTIRFAAEVEHLEISARMAVFKPHYSFRKSCKTSMEVYSPETCLVSSVFGMITLACRKKLYVGVMTELLIKEPFSIRVYAA